VHTASYMLVLYRSGQGEGLYAASPPAYRYDQNHDQPEFALLTSQSVGQEARRLIASGDTQHGETELSDHLGRLARAVAQEVIRLARHVHAEMLFDALWTDRLKTGRSVRSLHRRPLRKGTATI
jgi:hypothetical protein